MVLRDDEIRSFMRTLEESQLRSYTDEERADIEEKLNVLIEERKKKRVEENREFLRQFNENVPSEEFFESCEKAGRLFQSSGRSEVKGMKEYIEREALKRELIDNKSFYPAIVKCSLERIPAADVKEIVHAKWQFGGDGLVECSACEYTYASRDLIPRNFCPNCGAQMDLKNVDTQRWFPASIKPEADKLLIVKDGEGREYDDHLWDGYCLCKIVVNDDDTWDGRFSDVDVVSWRYKQRDI